MTTTSRRSRSLTFPSTLGILTAVQHTYSTIKLLTLISPRLAYGRLPLNPPLIPPPFPSLYPFRPMIVRLQHYLPDLPQSMILPIWLSLLVQPHLRHQIPHTRPRSTVPQLTQNLTSPLMTSLRHRQYRNSRPRSHRGCSIRYDMPLR